MSRCIVGRLGQALVVIKKDQALAMPVLKVHLSQINGLNETGTELMMRPPRIGSVNRGNIVKVPGWAVAIGAVVAGALGVALFLVSASLILILAPFVIGAVFYFRWRVRRALRKMAEQNRNFDARANADIIDGDYRIVEEPHDRFRR